MNRLAALFRALRAGEELAHTETWKHRQNAINALLALLGALVVWLPVLGVRLEVPHEDLLAIAGGVAAVGGLLNTYFTTATTRRIGVRARAGSAARRADRQPEARAARIDP
jgi:hypothetical protein